MRTVIALLVVALAVPARAETYHVAADGSDAAAGSADAPWATLQHAANEVAAGDIVRVHPGEYVGFYLTTDDVSFIADDGVRITSDNGETPDGINLEGASGVTIEGFVIEGATRAGIRAVTCDHVTLRGNRADRNGRWGILTGFCDDLLIEDNECSRSGAEHGIYVSNSGDRPVVRRNVMWGNNANGLHMNGDIYSGGDGVISDAVVEGNIIYDNGVAGGSGINGDGIVDAVIQNNLVFGNHASGISLYRIDGGAASTGNLVINNTVVMAADGRWAMNIQDGSTGNTLRNNILLHPSPQRGAVDLCADCVDGFASDYNVMVPRFTVGDDVLDLAGWRAATGGDAHSIEATAEALFVDPERGAEGYVLREGSPAVDIGSPDRAPETDLAGNARPQGDGVDIGALEQCVGPCQPPGGGGDGGGDDDDGGGGGAPGGPVAGGCAASRGCGSAGTLVLVALFSFRSGRRAGRSRTRRS